MNEEFPVSASHKLALITSLPFVHTARRYYRLDGLVSSLDWSRRRGNALVLVCREEGQTVLSRGSKSRNKVSVGEPAEGSLTKAQRLVGRALAKTETVTGYLLCLFPPQPRDKAAWRGERELHLAAPTGAAPWAVVAAQAPSP